MITEANFKSRLKYFVPIWMFPFIAIFHAVNDQLLGNYVLVLLFIALNTPALYGWKSGLIPFKEMIAFWWLMPFLLWVSLVFVKVKIFGI